jgi:hypothetical protein
MSMASGRHVERCRRATCVILTDMEASPKSIDPLKPIGFFLLVMGWILALAAVILLTQAGARTGFILAGLAVEVLGLVLVVRTHISPAPERD